MWAQKAEAEEASEQSLCVQHQRAGHSCPTLTFLCSVTKKVLGRSHQARGTVRPRTRSPGSKATMHQAGLQVQGTGAQVGAVCSGHHILQGASPVLHKAQRPKARDKHPCHINIKDKATREMLLFTFGGD